MTGHPERRQLTEAAEQLVRNKPAFYATLRHFQADPPPAGATI
jgi:hypothetical protein